MGSLFDGKYSQPGKRFSTYYRGVFRAYSKIYVEAFLQK